MVENSNFEQDFWSRTAEGIYETGHDSIRILKWLTYFDRTHYVIINYDDLMASVLISVENDN